MQRQQALLKFHEAKENARAYSLMNRAQTKYKYYISSGNNSSVVKRCMQLREERWEETNSFDKLFNFRWQPWARGLEFNIVNSFGVRQLINHF